MINADKPQRWNDDTKRSVLQYNEWFMSFAPKTYQDGRKACLDQVAELLVLSNNFTELESSMIVNNPKQLSTLRMLCAPPIARDRLSGLADVPRGTIKTMEAGRFPARNLTDVANRQIPAIVGVVKRLLDPQLLHWVKEGIEPDDNDLLVASSVIADRLCGSLSDPIMRNAQESRQLNVLSAYLESKGYTRFDDVSVNAFEMPRGTYAYHKNVRMYKNARDDSDGYVNTPVDVVITPMREDEQMPVLIECKSAGDFANTNKRRKEEDTKVTQLRGTYGDITLYLFLCGYFDSTYLGYEAANHMDWIWEHRIDDIEELL